MEVAFQYVNEFEENILGFCNNILYTGGWHAHLAGFKTKFTHAHEFQYARELGILKEKDQNFTGVDVQQRYDGDCSSEAPGAAF